LFIAMHRAADARFFDPVAKGARMAFQDRGAFPIVAGRFRPHNSYGFRILHLHVNSEWWSHHYEGTIWKPDPLFNEKMK
jgi:hypothetical protein